MLTKSMPEGEMPKAEPAEDGRDVYYLPQDCFGEKAEVGKTITMKVVEAPDDQGQVGVVVEGNEPMSEENMDAAGRAAFTDSDYA